VISTQRLHLLLWPAAAAFGLVAEWIAFDWTEPGRWIPDLLVGWTFIGCGLIASARRPDSGSGPLMAMTGFTWFLANFAGIDSGFVAWVAAHGVYLHRGPLLHLILAYPGGRASSKLSQVLLGVGYAAALVTPVWDSEVASFVLSALLIAGTSWQYRQAVGRQRRARLLSVWAAAGLGLVLAGGAATRLALPEGEVVTLALLAYELMLFLIAGSLFAGLVLAAWETPDVTDLVVELGAARSGTLRGALSRALGDPSLEIGYWLEGADSFVDSEGRRLSLPDPGSKRSVTLIERDDQPVAAILHDPAVLDDPGLLEAVTSAAQLAASNARLQAEVQNRVVELTASRRRILDARDEERMRLERRLREGAQHRLEQLAETLRRGRQSSAGAQSLERIVHAEEQLSRTLEDLRRLAQGLHPRILSEHGLESALSSLAEGFPARVEFEVTTDRMAPALEAAAYFVCAEALANVAKYALASTVTVSVTADDSAVAVIVQDDGVGGADPARGSGLSGLADRIGTLGGSLRIESEAGHGTRLAAEIPLGGEQFDR
jgi:signal transduction histidine kinase